MERSPTKDGQVRGAAARPGGEAAPPGGDGWLSGPPDLVLARIAQGDPLGVRECVAERMRAEAVLVDADRAHLRALVHVARGAALETKPVSASRLAARVEEAARRGVREALEAARDAVRGGEDEDAFAVLAPPLGLPADRARRAVSAFNRCAPKDRRALQALVVEGRSLDELARDEGVSATRIARRARRALEAALGALTPRAREARS